VPGAKGGIAGTFFVVIELSANVGAAGQIGFIDELPVVIKT
jgi:hypothetical protein